MGHKHDLMVLEIQPLYAVDTVGDGCHAWHKTISPLAVEVDFNDRSRRGSETGV